jgi:hypothetical protein
MTARQKQVIAGEVDTLVEQLVGEHMRELREQMAALEKLTNAAIASLPPAARAKYEPKADKPKGSPRWLDGARYANKCAGECGDRVQRGERAWFVPGVGIYHESCAPAEAHAKVAA